MHETDENEMWEMLLAARKRLAEDAPRWRAQHAESEEQRAQFRESNPRIIAQLDDLEALTRRAFANNPEKLAHKLAGIEEMRQTEARYGAALEHEAEQYIRTMESLTAYEESLDELEQELRSTRS